MKRLSSLLIALTVLLVLTALSPAKEARSQVETLVRVSPAEVTLAPGQSKTIAVEVVAVTEMRAFEVTINFDPSLIYIPPASLVDGGFLVAGLPSPANEVDNDAGMLNYGWAIMGNDVSSGSGTLFTFTVVAKQVLGSTALEIVESELVHNDYFEILHEVENGLVRIATDQDPGYQLYLPLILQ